MLNKKIFIPVANPTVGMEEANLVHKQIKSGWFSMGKKVKEFEKKYSDTNTVPRPPHWSGWRVIPKEIEFWLDGEGRIHERLVYINNIDGWKKKLLYP